ncbi:unnamed protein product, partial [Polarella glacialis]
CSWTVAGGGVRWNVIVPGAVPAGHDFRMICYQINPETSTTTVTETSTSITSTSTSSSTSTVSSTSSTVTSTTTSTVTSTTSSTFTSTTTSTTSTTSTTTTTTTTPAKPFNITWALDYLRPHKGNKLVVSCAPTACNPNAVGFLAADDAYSSKVEMSCEEVTEMRYQPILVYDTYTATSVIRTTIINSFTDDTGLAVTDGLEAWVSAWSDLGDIVTNWTVLVEEADQLRIGRTYKFCIDPSGPGSWNGITLSEVEVYFSVYIPGIKSAYGSSGLMYGTQARLNVECEPMGAHWQLGCEKPLTSAYLSTACDSTDDDGLREVSLGTGTMQANLDGPGAPYYHFTFDTTPLVPGNYYWLCEDLDGIGTVTSFHSSGVKVYVSGVSGALPIRTFVSAPVIMAAPEQKLKLTCADGCSIISLAYVGDTCDSAAGTEERSTDAFFSGTAPDFEVEFDASNLTFGKTYLLCTDLDGSGEMLFGETSIFVAASPINATSEMVVMPDADQRILLTCGGHCME